VISAALVGKNKGHPAVFPVDIPEFFIRLLCPPDGVVADPFAGSGTTGIAALALGRRCILIDNNEKFCDIARERIKKEANARDEEVTTVSLREATYTPEIPQKVEEQIRFFEDAPDFAPNGKKLAKKRR
jgi:16S rRNA G966 N2-methylase RsmD